MKKLLKNVIYRSVNSARKHCSQKTWSIIAAWRKKKKRKKKKRGHANAQSKHILNTI